MKTAAGCPITGCWDDVCHGSQECMRTGEPLGQRCPVCDEVSIPDLDMGCACEQADAEEWDHF